MTHHGNWLKVTSLNVSQANELLGASYQFYRHTETNDTILRTISYALPASLESHVKTVAPTTYFGSPRTLTQSLRIPPGDTSVVSEEFGKMPSSRAEDGLVTPSYLRRLYNLETYVPKAMYQNVLGVAGYNMQFPNHEDLLLFMKEFRTSATDMDYLVVPVNGDLYIPDIPGVEASLNIQYTQGMAYPTPQVFYSTAGQAPFIRDSSTPVIPGSDIPVNTNEPFLEWLEFLLSKPYIPPTISTSYSDNEQTVPEDYARSVCDSFAELGTRGVSVLISSGDFGVGEGDCKVNDNSGKEQFLPRFPSSCMYNTLYIGTGASRSLHRHALIGPWVTSVGGTEEYPEVAASFSSGGFSNYFQVPYYQDSEVSRYIRNLDGLHDGLFKCVRCHDPVLTSLYFVIRAALRVVGSLTSPRKRASSRFMWTRSSGSPVVQPARHPCVFSFSDSLLFVLSIREHTANCHAYRLWRA